MSASSLQIISTKDFKEFVDSERGILILTVSWCKSALMMAIIFDRYQKYYINKQY